jgi:hypothetical protein
MLKRPLGSARIYMFGTGRAAGRQVNQSECNLALALPVLPSKVVDVATTQCDQLFGELPDRGGSKISHGCRHSPTTQILDDHKQPSFSLIRIKTAPIRMGRTGYRFPSCIDKILQGAGSAQQPSHKSLRYHESTGRAGVEMVDRIKRGHCRLSVLGRR